MRVWDSQVWNTDTSNSYLVRYYRMAAAAPQGTAPSWSRSLYNNLNFFRIHLLYFIFLPLIVSGIFYAADKGSLDGDQDGSGTKGTSYIDSLFLCYSAMT